MCCFSRPVAGSGRTIVWVAVALGRRLHLAFPFSFSILWPSCHAGGWPTAPRFPGNPEAKAGSLNYTYIVSPRFSFIPFTTPT